MLRVALIPRGLINHGKGKPSCIQSEGYPIRGGLAEKQRLAQALFCIWRYSRTIYIIFGMFECCLLNHIYIHSFRSIIKATVPKSFPGVGAFDHLEWTYDGAFEQLFGLGRGEFEQNFSKTSNARGVAAGDVEATIWLVHWPHWPRISSILHLFLRYPLSCFSLQDLWKRFPFVLHQNLGHFEANLFYHAKI